MLLIPCLLLSFAQGPSVRAVLELSPLLLETAIEHADPLGAHLADGAPLRINLASFVVNGSMSARSDITDDNMRRALARSFVKASPGQLFACPSQPCDQSRGLYVELNSLAWGVEGYEGVLTARWVDQRTGGLLVLQFETIKVTFRWKGHWTKESLSVLSQS